MLFNFYFGIGAHTFTSFCLLVVLIGLAGEGGNHNRNDEDLVNEPNNEQDQSRNCNEEINLNDRFQGMFYHLQ